MAARLLRPLWRPLWDGLVAFGTLHATGQLPPPVRPEAHPLAGPPPGHPERLRADVPLTAQERRLAGSLPPLTWPDEV